MTKKNENFNHHSSLCSQTAGFASARISQTAIGSKRQYGSLSQSVTCPRSKSLPNYMAVQLDAAFELPTKSSHAILPILKRADVFGHPTPSTPMFLGHIRNTDLTAAAYTGPLIVTGASVWWISIKPSVCTKIFHSIYDNCSIKKTCITRPFFLPARSRLDFDPMQYCYTIALVGVEKRIPNMHTLSFKRSRKTWKLHRSPLSSPTLSTYSKLDGSLFTKTSISRFCFVINSMKKLKRSSRKG